MKAILRRVFPVCAVLALVVSIGSLLRPRRVFSDEDDAENAVKLRSFVTRVNGHAIISLNTQTQRLMGLQTASLRLVSEKKSVAAVAIVLPVSDLVTLRQNILQARAQIAKARTALTTSQKEYQRLKKLYAENQNASQKSVEVAHAACEADQTDWQTAEQQLRLAQAAAAIRWGRVVAKWLAVDSPQLDRVLSRKDVLIQLTFPSGTILQPPRFVPLRIPGGETVDAHYLSAYPQMDPRILGPSYLYRSAARPALVPGMTLAVRVPAGAEIRGVFLPRSAEVWWRGRPWIYREGAPGKFSRQPVLKNAVAMPGGFLLPGLAPGEEVVTQGAMTLLSEEFRSRIAAAEEG